MLEKITKKEFINTLVNSVSEILYINLSLTEKHKDSVISIIKNGTYNINRGRRCISSNNFKIVFDSGSRLYIDDDLTGATCYRVNNIIISIKPYWDKWDEINKYALLAYIIA